MSNEVLQQKKIIICVDDEQIVLDSLYRQLQRRFGDQYLYELAESGEEAKEIAEQFIKEGYKVVMVISDQIMPGITGDKLLIDFQASNPKAVKILLTGQASLDSAINSINNANLYRYITKPWDESDLLLTIEKGLERYNLFDKTEKQLALFQKFVPQQFLEYLYKNDTELENIKLGDHVAIEMTILFSDIRNFTTISEVLSPEHSFNFINSCIRMIDPAIRDNHGFIDKFIGDAVMALFVKPEDGLSGAIAIEKAIANFNKDRQANDVNYVPLEIGVGLHIGTVMLGVVGVESRLQVTVVSDAVNMASRLENLSKVYGTSVIISDEVYNHISNKEKFSFRALGEVPIKGKAKQAIIYEVINALPEDIAQKKLATLKEFEEGVKFYREGKYTEAITNFNLVLKNNPDDKAAHVYLINATSKK
jgi:two-component system sensor histidine kinase ChiS